MYSLRAPSRKVTHSRRQGPGWWVLPLAGFLIVVVYLVAVRPDYRETFTFIIRGLTVTVQITVASFVLAALLGAAVIRGRQQGSALRQLTLTYTELVNGIPVLVLIFLLTFVGTPWLANTWDFFRTAFRPEAVNAVGVILALSVAHSVTAANLLDGRLPRAWKGEGLRDVGILAPSLLRLLLVTLKDSSLASIVAVPDITYQTRLYAVGNFVFDQSLLILAALYLALALTLSLLARLIIDRSDAASREEVSRTNRPRSQPDRPASAGALKGGNMDPTHSEVTRYLAASIVLSPNTRNQIRSLIESEHQALVPELGIAFEQLVHLSYLMDARERRFDWWLGGTAVLGFVGFFLFESLLVPFLALLIAWGIQFYKNYDQRYRLVPLLRKNSFNLAELERRLTTRYRAESVPRDIPQQGQNVVVYGDFIPFVGAGYALGGWSFPVNISRPLKDMGTATIQDFTIAELYETVEQKVAECQFPEVTIRSCLFANGRQIRDERWLLPTIYDHPVNNVDERMVRQHYENERTAARHYKWIQVFDWGNEIVISYFLRFVKQGDHLFVEANRFLLTPLQDQYREIDSILPPTPMTLVTTGTTSLVAAPFVAIFSLLRLVGRFARIINDWDPFGRKRRKKEKQMEQDVHFNYGAHTSFRHQVSQGRYNHYFQMLDKEMVVKVLEKQILETIINFLEDHKIDPSDIRERRPTILNSGLIVQGGEVRAEALSVGRGAWASAASASPQETD